MRTHGFQAGNAMPWLAIPCCGVYGKINRWREMQNNKRCGLPKACAEAPRSDEVQSLLPCLSGVMGSELIRATFRAGIQNSGLAGELYVSKSLAPAFVKAVFHSTSKEVLT